MTEAGVATRPQTPAWRVVVRAVFTLMASAVVAAWLFFAWFQLVFRCDDSCSGNQAESWIYPGQFAVAVVGSLLAISSMVLGFKRREGAYRSLVVLSLVFFLSWVGWMLSGQF